MPAWMKTAPGVPGPESLGAEGPEDFLAPEALSLLAGAELLPGPQGEELIRFRLPGTPGPDGRRRGRPMGAGTGTLILRRFSGLSPELLRSRVTRPRSASLGERTWNTLCALRAEGVGTPEPMAVGASGSAPVTRTSFVITRDLEDFLPLATWAEGRTADERERAARALAAAVERLARAGVDLPRASRDTVWLSRPKGEACGLGAPPAAAAAGTPNRLPGVVFADVGEARFGGLSARRRAELEGLATWLERPAPARVPE